MTKTITISIRYYQNLIDAEARYQAMQIAGVDCWEGEWWQHYVDIIIQKVLRAENGDELELFNCFQENLSEGELNKFNEAYAKSIKRLGLA